jgi:hypothetical protein
MHERQGDRHGGYYDNGAHDRRYPDNNRNWGCVMVPPPYLLPFLVFAQGVTRPIQHHGHANIAAWLPLHNIMPCVRIQGAGCAISPRVTLPAAHALQRQWTALHAAAATLQIASAKRLQPATRQQPAMVRAAERFFPAPFSTRPITNCQPEQKQRKGPIQAQQD